MSDSVGHIRAFLESIGLDPAADPELVRTPERVDRLMRDLFSSLRTPEPELSVSDCADQELVLLRDIPFRSTCVHHLVPFFGTVDIAYVPGQKIAGFGGFGRAIDWVSRKHQLQERLVEELADLLERQLSPTGLLVRAQARHMCVELRSRHWGTFETTASRGSLAEPTERAALLTRLSSAPDE